MSKLKEIFTLRTKYEAFAMGFGFGVLLMIIALSDWAMRTHL